MRLLRKANDLLFIIPFSVLLVVINVIRIFKIPITIDETGYLRDETYTDLLFKKYASANNHILHSVFRKFFVEAFWNTLFFLRLDSLLAQIAFLIFSYLLCNGLFKNKYWVVCGFVILNLASPFIFDFWGLSRGYALSISFMTVSVYYLIKYTESQKLVALSLSVITGGLAVYSNFGLLNYYVALLAVVVLQRILFRDTNQDRPAFGKELLVLLSFSCMLALLITGPLILLHRGGELSFLGSSGFKEDTVTSLVRCSIFNRGESFKASQIVRIVYWGTFIISAFWLYILIVPGKLKQHLTEARSGITLHLLLIIPALSLVAQYHLFKINYIIDRAAIFFIILYLLQLIYWLYYFRLALVKYCFGVVAVITVLVSYNFFSNLDMHRAFLWWFDEADLVVLNRMHKEWEGKPGKIKLWAEWEFLPSFKYDIEQHYRNEFDMAEAPRYVSDTDTTYDYLYLRNDDVGKVPAVYQKDTAVCGGGSFILFRKR